MGRTRGHCEKLNKTDTERQGLYILSHIWNLTEVDLNVEGQLVDKGRLGFISAQIA